MQNWIHCLNNYNYYVNTNQFINDNPNLKNNPLIKNVFNYEVIGNRESTILYENRFRKNVEKSIGYWIELVYWKMYSQGGRRNQLTKNVLNHIKKNNYQSKNIFQHSEQFLQDQTVDNFHKVKEYFGFTSDAIATVATIFAFLKPELFPMIDTRVAKWVICQSKSINKNRPNEIVELCVPSNYGRTKATVLTTKDWDFYLNWIEWTRDVAKFLSSNDKESKINWRPRDVEMAVFYAWGDRGQDHPIIELNLY